MVGTFERALVKRVLFSNFKKFLVHRSYFSFLARILTYVDDRGRDRQVLVSSADGLAEIKLDADDGKFS